MASEIVIFGIIFTGPHILCVIRRYVPEAVGFQVLMSGWAIILFDKRKSMKAYWKRTNKGSLPRNITDIGCLRPGYGIFSCKTTTGNARSGCSISSRPDRNQSASVGLRLRLLSGTDALTTVTHAFVPIADTQMSSSRGVLTNAILSLKKRLPGMTQVQEQGTSPLGKAVCLAGTHTTIGTITASYDRCPCDEWLAYPHGFSHDLSLITDEKLPHLISPTGSPRITEWGPYEEVLRGDPIFVYQNNISTGNFRSCEAIAEGTQYTWDDRYPTYSTALLWRMADGDNAPNASGSVLCLGKPDGPQARAVLFQNFEGQVVKSEDVRGPDGATFKGGFLLPEEIRQSDILIN